MAAPIVIDVHMDSGTSSIVQAGGDHTVVFGVTPGPPGPIGIPPVIDGGTP